MSKSKKDRPLKSVVEAKSEKKRPVKEKGLVVFAFRLTGEERDAIHKAAGPSRASRFVRALATAAARQDETAIRQILKEAQAGRG
jgi:hypothetical protein